MHRLNYGLLLLGLAACAAVVTGCQGGDGGQMLDTEYVTGTVTLDGQPVGDATVTFVPVTEGQGVSATGTTDASGKYELTAVPTGEVTAKAGAGTVPGEYYVGVRKAEFPQISEDEEEREAVAPGEDGVKHLVPQKYNNPKESGIQVTVQEGENNIPIELSSQ